MATPNLFFVEYLDGILLQYGTHYKQVKKDINLLNNLQQKNYKQIIDEYFPEEYISVKFTNIIVNDKKYIKIQQYLFPIKYENFVSECLQNGLNIDKIYEIYCKIIKSKNDNLIAGLVNNNYYKIKNDYIIYNQECFLLDNYIVNNKQDPSYDINSQYKIKSDKNDSNFEFLNKLKKPHYKKCKLCGADLIYNEKSEYCYSCELGIGLKNYKLSNFKR